jgi:alpha-aminoadipic semialdehyde synthase
MVEHSGGVGTIAVIRECKNKWERRCSITPTEVAILTKQGVRVLVQPSTTRCFTDDEFQEAGAIL